jgi:hypothetical protein
MKYGTMVLYSSCLMPPVPLLDYGTTHQQLSYDCRSEETHDIPQLRIGFVKLLFQIFCLFTQLLQIIRYCLFHLDVITIESISLSHHEPTRQRGLESE